MHCLLRSALALGAAALLAGCATGVALPGFDRASARSDATEPWTLGAAEIGTQRLFRVEYSGQRERVGFRLTLHLERADRFRLDAVDPLGRKVWTLDVSPGGSALFLDHRHERHCRLASSREQSALPLAHLPPAAIPRLLLGALPAEPASDLARDDAGRLSYRDASGRLWTATATLASDGTAARGLERWTVSDAGEPVAWWRQRDEEAVFVDRRGQQQVSWRQQVVEPLAKPLEPVQVPAGWRTADCASLGAEGAA